jgi:hypothetical protein
LTIPIPLHSGEWHNLINESIGALGLPPAALEGVGSKNVLRILLNADQIDNLTSQPLY